MVRLILLGVLVLAFFLLYRMLFPPAPKQRGPAESTEMVQDPNCQTYIPKNQAVLKTRKGEEYYFCSEQCADEYIEKIG